MAVKARPEQCRLTIIQAEAASRIGLILALGVMKIGTALLAYFLAVVVLIGLGVALVGVIGGVVLMGSFATDSPTCTAGPALLTILSTLGHLLVVWCAPAHEALKLSGADKSEFILVLGIVVEPIFAAFFWALLAPLGLYLFSMHKRDIASRNT